MPLVVMKSGSRWLTIDTDTHKVKGNHETRSKALAQRRVLASLRKKGRAK